jgi:hypothetical protein
MRLVKSNIILLCCFAIHSLNVSAQENNAVTMPATPAFSILEFEPSSVLKPGNLKDLATDVLSAFDENGKLLMNLGLNVTPYWLKSRPTLTKNRYLYPTFKQTILQSLNFSAATVRDSVTDNNKLGVGVRFRLLNGKPLPEYLEKEAELKGKLDLINVVAICLAFVGTAINTRQDAIDMMVETLVKQQYKQPIIDAFKTAAENEAKKFDDSLANIKTFITTLATSIFDSTGELKSKVAALSKKRVGFILELAGAGSFITSSGDQVFERSGIWLNASNYVSETDVLNITARYLFSNRDSALTNFDIGFSYQKELTRFAFSIEGMLRWFKADILEMEGSLPVKRTEKDFTYRLAAQASYNINKDFGINISLGKNFDSPLITKSGYFSILGFNYNIFKKERVDLAK